MKKILLLKFFGLVQGVGFRYGVKSLTLDLNLKGFVKNLDDGSVEVVIEGEEQDLKEFLAKIRQNFSKSIKKLNLQWLESKGEFQNFEIKF